MEDFHPRYIEGDESAPAFVHPGLLLNMSNNTRSPSFFLPGGWAEIHAAEETRYLSPARLGEKLRVTWEVVEAYEKRGRPWHVLDVRTRRRRRPGDSAPQDDQHLCGPGPGRKGTGRKQGKMIAKDTEVGREFSGRPKKDVVGEESPRSRAGR